MLTPFHTTMIAILANEQHMQEVLGLKTARPGGPLQLYGDVRRLLSSTTAEESADHSPGSGESTNQESLALSPEYSG